ncbi:zinc finger protein RFP-like [Lagopus leucura]|uniref:zinc finger protein RFP-like n=1 Tax=Lagopus leucura TaxID=30410 RepID=UPI001C685F50|nr:zinc finger protein RFP-like [Lagopus leucura]XP_042747313.1 zinc finger protein RFP-like [Lagopus leucura]XP_042747314.1 zinc finger protein RFP-like [Lagopus leucura]XP_042747315.1 zinc finger protein RFP-like [Lagopus leucura]XP_042747317.1 zinc finger protein RFP-like [Lagopus leucura]
MASAASRAKEKGEGGSHHPVPEHRMDDGGGGGAWPERGRLGDTEVIGHRNHLRKGNFHTKLHLEHLAEKLKLLGLDGDKGEKEKLCSWRKRTFLSNGPRDDGGPTGAPIKESVQEDGEQICSHLENLKKQRKELLELKTSGERQCQDFLTRTEAERQKIASEFRQLRRFLKEKEVMLLARLGELDRAVLRRQEEEEAKVQGDISLLSILICEMEEKLKRPTRGFLQDARSTLNRWEMGRTQRTTESFADVERRLRVISQQNKILKETLGRFQDLLPSELEKEEGASVGEEGEAFVTLDPSTATAGLVLSRDRRGVRWMDTGHNVSPCPQRFDVSCCVLGCRGFTSGRHFWDVEVMGGGTWALGVARSSVPRKGWLAFHPDYGIWAVGCCRNRFRAFTSPPTALPLGGNPNRIRVVLDYGGGRVAFYLAAQKNPVFAFQNASFCGESIFPFFWVGRESHLHLCP